MINGENFGWELSGDKSLYNAEGKALSRNQLFHYTTISTLKKIFQNKQLKFNRIDKVNDVRESSVFFDRDVTNLVFVSCFTHLRMESIPMWYIYGKQKGDLDTVRIGFNFKFDSCNRDITSAFIDKKAKFENSSKIDIPLYVTIPTGIHPKYHWYSIIQASDIVYNTNKLKTHPIKYGDIFSLSSMAKIKRREWKYEEETRLILFLRTFSQLPAPNIDYFLVPIKYDNLKNITITFNPWMPNEYKKDVKHFFKSMNELKELNIPIYFKNSILTGEMN